MNDKVSKNIRISIPRSESFFQILKFPLRHILNLLGKKNISINQQLAVFSFDHISHDINIDGIYEKDYLNTLVVWLKEFYPSVFNGSAIDVGANIGNHSLFFSNLFRKVYSFEPNPKTYQLLKFNTYANKNISTKNIGLSNKKGVAKLLINDLNIGGSSIVDKKTNKAVDINLNCVDDEINLDEKIKLIKIDVEGHELEVLQGSSKIIKKNSPLIIFEQNRIDFYKKFPKIKLLLNNLDYSEFGIIKRKSNLSILNFLMINKYIFRILCVFTKEYFEIEIVKDIKPDNYPFIIGIPNNEKIKK